MAKVKSSKKKSTKNADAVETSVGTVPSRYEVYAQWLQDEKGLTISAEQAQVAVQSYKEFQKSDVNRTTNAARAQAGEQAKAEREAKRAERAANKEAREQERATKKAEREASKEAKAKKAASKKSAAKESAKASEPKKKSTKKAGKGKSGKSPF